MRKLARKRIVDRIEVSDYGCWEWSLKIRPNGYARVTFLNDSWYAHRLSYFAFKGDIPFDSDVCHCCDNRKCVNPEHLFLGSRKDNMQDCVLKERQAKGERLPHSKLLDDERLQVLDLILFGFTYSEIGSWYGVTRHAINHIAIINGIRKRKCKKA
ncbi:putative homing endonuclease [Vibrio phage 199E37-1]|nr:putative homing endonuclease [Vibrio phage 199E37-1]